MPFPFSAGDKVEASELNKVGPFGAWASKSENTVYQAETDGFVVCQAYLSADFTYIYSDSSNPPTTARVRIKLSTYDNYTTIMCPVRRGDYWKTVNALAGSTFWLPIGS
jgi:trehalose-6-phosphate synthase